MVVLSQPVTAPLSHHNWGYGVAKKDLDKLQPKCEVIQQLWWEGLIGVHLMRMFFCHRIQLLR
jgi:hypothetical protein